MGRSLLGQLAARGVGLHVRHLQDGQLVEVVEHFFRELSAHDIEGRFDQLIADEIARFLDSSAIASTWAATCSGRRRETAGSSAWMRFQ